MVDVVSGGGDGGVAAYSMGGNGSFDGKTLW